VNGLLHAEWLGRQPYAAALSRQEALLERAASDLAAEDHLLLLEHDHVYTLGRGADERDLQGAPERLGVPSFRVGRGGGVTYHGPGQLIGYPVIRLPRGDVQGYMHLLEEVLIATCAQFDVPAMRRADAIGVWAKEGKIGSIGIGVRRGVSYHGIALNVAPDLRYFEQVIPCRETALRFTALDRAMSVAPPMIRVAETFRDCFAQIFGYREVRSMGL
jgi:lipoyl(octanoyl) transferase